MNCSLTYIHRCKSFSTFITNVKSTILLICVCSNANPLHYYVLRVPRRADRWRWVWSIFNSRTAWADHITCGMSICIVYFDRFIPTDVKFFRHFLVDLVSAIYLFSKQVRGYSLFQNKLREWRFWGVSKRLTTFSLSLAQTQNEHRLKQNCAKFYFEYFLCILFFCKAKNNRNIKGEGYKFTVQCPFVSLSLENGWLDFHQTLYPYRLYFILK